MLQELPRRTKDCHFTDSECWIVRRGARRAGIRERHLRHRLRRLPLRGFPYSLASLGRGVVERFLLVGYDAVPLSSTFRSLFSSRGIVLFSHRRPCAPTNFDLRL